jgi:hypothetical protein
LAKRKAAELEGFEESEMKEWNSSKSERVKGGILISEFLDKVKLAKVENLEKELPNLVIEHQKIFDNPFVSEIVNEF